MTKDYLQESRMTRVKHVMRRHVFSMTLAMFACAHSVSAQVEPVDITGDWTNVGTQAAGGNYHEEALDRGPGPFLGDYTGLPINDVGRYKAWSYSPNWLNMPEYQCIPHPSTYQHRGPNGISIAKEYDFKTRQLVAYRTTGTYGVPRTIWMDGRPHPPENARHTFEGFSTGRWEGDKLVVTTTHIKQGWIRRNGPPHSDKVRLTEYYIRNGEFLTFVTAVDDPYYFDEPFVVSSDFRLDPRANTQLRDFGGHINGGPGPIWYKCMSVEELDVPPGTVPSFVEGANPFLQDFANMYGIPLEASYGGALTLYPEYQARLRQMVAGENVQPAPARSEPRRSVPAAAPEQEQVTSQHVAGQVWAVTAGGRNIAVQIGSEGILVVDPGQAELASAVMAEIRRLAGDDGKQVRMIINTSADPARIAANPIIGAATPADGLLNGPLLSANIIAHENVSLNAARMAAGAGLIGGAIPNDTFYGDKRTFSFNDEAIEVIHLPAAHSNADAIVVFRRSDVIVAGNMIQDATYPVIDPNQGGSLEGMIDGLNRIIGLAIPSYRGQGGTLVIPGQGRVYDVTDVALYRDMATILRDRFQDAIQKGRTLEQVKAARLTRDYDGRYGSGSGPGSTDAFVEAAYQSLAGN